MQRTVSTLMAIIFVGNAAAAPLSGSSLSNPTEHARTREAIFGSQGLSAAVASAANSHAFSAAAPEMVLPLTASVRDSNRGLVPMKRIKGTPRKKTPGPSIPSIPPPAEQLDFPAAARHDMAWQPSPFEPEVIGAWKAWTRGDRAAIDDFERALRARGALLYADHFSRADFQGYDFNNPDRTGEILQHRLHRVDKALADQGIPALDPYISMAIYLAAENSWQHAVRNGAESFIWFLRQGHDLWIYVIDSGEGFDVGKTIELDQHHFAGLGLAALRRELPFILAKRGSPAILAESERIMLHLPNDSVLASHQVSYSNATKQIDPMDTADRGVLCALHVDLYDLASRRISIHHRLFDAAGPFADIRKAYMAFTTAFDTFATLLTAFALTHKPQYVEGVYDALEHIESRALDLLLIDESHTDQKWLLTTGEIHMLWRILGEFIGIPGLILIETSQLLEAITKRPSPAIDDIAEEISFHTLVDYLLSAVSTHKFDPGQTSHLLSFLKMLPMHFAEMPVDREHMRRLNENHRQAA